MNVLQNYKTEWFVGLGKSALIHTARLIEPSRRSKKNDDKSVVALLNAGPPKSSSIFRKGTDMPKPIQRVKFTKAIARHTKIRDQNPSLGHTCPGEPS